MLILCLFLYTFGLIVSVGAAILGALSDVRSFRIPNHLSLLAALGFVLAYVATVLVPGPEVPLLHPLVFHLLSGCLIFVVTLILFFTGVIGAGDAKLASAVALWISPNMLPAFVFYMSLVGGVMAIMTLFLKRVRLFRRVRKGGWLASAQAGENRIPYGVAIMVAFIAICTISGYFDITEIIKAVEKGG